MVMATDRGGRKAEMFWGEIAPCEHLVQIYDGESAFLNSLEGFIAGGLRGGEGVVVIATPDHLAALEDRLRAGGSMNLASPSIRDRYIALDADQVLSSFMVDGWPDDALFDAVVSRLLERAGEGGRRVRAFGEMVALLWQRGNAGATVRLEHLWHKLCHERGFSLFCAYPRIGFTQDADAAIKEICDAHSMVVDA
jgi:hypothetical protein